MSEGLNERDSSNRMYCLIGVFALASIILIVPTSQLARIEGPIAVRGARNTLILFVTPNILTFGVTAFIIRRAWRGLALKECVFMGWVLAAATYVLLMVLALPFAALMNQSATVLWLVYFVWMVLPGILSAQILRYAKSIWAPRAT